MFGGIIKESLQSVGEKLLIACREQLDRLNQNLVKKIARNCE